MLKDILIKTIINNNMLREGDGVVVGFSGGGDSAALLHALAQLASELKIKLYACHLNHKIRGAAADEDMRFCEDFTAKLGVPIYIKELNVADIAAKRGWNLEEAGRNARLAFYRRAMSRFGADKAATAHHMNDQAETFLINLLRGSGGTGLSGIAPVRDGWLIRPLIKCPKSEIEKYLKENSIPFRTDETNADRTILRNRVRLDLIPLLEKDYNPRLAAALSQTADIIRGSDELSMELADAFYKNISRPSWDSVSMDRALFTVLPVHLKRLLVRKAFLQMAGSGRRLSFEQVEDIVTAERAGGKDKRLSLPFGLEAHIGEGAVAIHLAGDKPETPGFGYGFDIPGELEIRETGARWQGEIKKYSTRILEESIKDPLVGVFDADSLPKHITVRSWRDGDRMQPLGMKGTKKLQDIFTDKKIPRRRRAELCIFESGGEIFWIAGVATGEKCKVSSETKNVAVFEPIG